MRSDLPTGTVTLLFTDIEGSTKLLHELGSDAYADALAEHRRLLREAYHRHGGVEVDSQGDAFFYGFPHARDAVTAAEEGREVLRAGRIHVRVGIHTGEPHLGPEGYAPLHVGLSDRVEVAIDVLRFAEALAGVGRVDEAGELLSLAAALREELGARTPWVEREAEETLDAVRERLDPSTLERAWERGKRLTPEASVAMALGLPSS